MSQMQKVCDFCCLRPAQRNIGWYLKSLLFVLASLFVGAAAVFLCLRFAISPHVKAYVEDARLNSFALENTSRSSPDAVETTSFLRYNISISVALTVRNLNGAMDITYTKPLMAAFLFYDRLLYNVTVAGEGHKHKPRKRDVYLLHTGGKVPYVLDTAAVEEFKKQNATGVLKAEMRLSGEITLGIANNRKLELSCPLTLQRPPPGPDVVVFHEVNCEPDQPKRIIF